MRDDVIWYKESEYVGKVGTSICLGRRDKARKQTEMLLVLYRLQSRQISQMCIRDRTGMDEPLVHQLSCQGHSWVATFGRDKR